MNRLFLAALLALTAVFAHAQNFTTMDSSGAQTATPFTTPMQLYRPFFGKGYVVHLPLTSSWRMPNGDNIDVGPDGAVYRNALRLNTRTTSATGTVTVTKNVCAEIMVVGNELYCRAKSDASKVYRWNNALTRWEAAPADAYAPLLALPPNPSLPSFTTAEPRSFVAFPSPAPTVPPPAAAPFAVGVISGVSAACVATGLTTGDAVRVLVWIDSSGYQEAELSSAPNGQKAWRLSVPSYFADGRPHAMRAAVGTAQGGSTNFDAPTTFTCSN
jgi:hypothetical protein